MSRPYTEARQRANNKFNEKTYKKYTFYLRFEEDAEVIKSIEEAKAKGISMREWLSELHELSKGI